MNWHDWGPTIVAAILGIFTYGRLTEKVATNSKEIEHVRRAFVKHADKVDDKLEDHGEAIAALEARPRYVNGASH